MSSVREASGLVSYLYQSCDRTQTNDNSSAINKETFCFVLHYFGKLTNLNLTPPQTNLHNNFWMLLVKCKLLPKFNEKRIAITAFPPKRVIFFPTSKHTQYKTQVVSSERVFDLILFPVFLPVRLRAFY